MKGIIQEGAVKVIEVIGVSGKSFDDAVVQAVRKASESISGINGVEVVKFSARVENGGLVQYRANLKLAFPVK